MSEFFNLPSVTPQLSDQLIVVRDRRGQAATLQSLKTLMRDGDDGTADSAIAFSQTPPADKLIWFQLDEDGYLLERWQRAAGLWLSQQSYSIESFDTQVKRNRDHYCANPLFDEAIWIESLSAKGWVWDDMRSGDYIDFSLYLVDGNQRKTKIHYLRLEGASRGNTFNFSESVERVATMDDALAFLLQVRRQGQTKLKTTSVTVQVRRVYAEG